MDAFLLAFLFYVAVFWFLARLASDFFHGRLQRAAKDLEEIEQRLPVPLTVDEINGTLYGWHHDTKDFVCQGRTLQELRDSFRARYPHKGVHIVHGPDDVLNRLRVELGALLRNEMLNSKRHSP